MKFLLLETRKSISYRIINTWDVLYCHLKNSCCAAMKYSDRTSDIMCGCLVEPFFHMSTTVLLSQWNSMDLPFQQ